MGKFRHEILNQINLTGAPRGLQENPLSVNYLINQIKEENIKSYLSLQKIFFCYRLPSFSEYFCLNILFDAISKGVVDVSTEFISAAPEIENFRQEIGIVGKGPEALIHQAMKKWVVQFFRSKDILCEEDISFLGFKVDVGSLRKEIFIECGDTKPRKVIEFLRNNLTIGVLPHNCEEIFWLKPKAPFSELSEFNTADLSI